MGSKLFVKPVRHTLSLQMILGAVKRSCFYRTSGLIGQPPRHAQEVELNGLKSPDGASADQPA